MKAEDGNVEGRKVGRKRRRRQSATSPPPSTSLGAKLVVGWRSERIRDGTLSREGGHQISKN
jgi:hypothetical protein